MIRPLIDPDRARAWNERATLLRELSCVKQQIKAIADSLDLTVKEATELARHEEEA